MGNGLFAWSSYEELIYAYSIIKYSAMFTDIKPAQWCLKCIAKHIITVIQ